MAAYSQRAWSSNVLDGPVGIPTHGDPASGRGVSRRIEMNRLLAAVGSMLLCVCLAHGQDFSRVTNFSTAPPGAVSFESTETLLTSAQRACSSSTITVTRTSASVLT